MTKPAREIFIYFSGLVALLISSVPVSAATESDWVEHQYSRSRVIASHEGVPKNADTILYLGWEVILPEGWKTYWRTPGDAGRPASFDWQGSTNVKAARVLYPKPYRFEIFGLQTFGYEGTVIIPIRLYPEHPGLPIHIELSTWFMACQEICVPFEAKYTLDLPATETMRPSLYASKINEQLARVPKISSFTSGGPRLQIARVRGQAGHQRLTVLIDGDKLLSGADVIVEAGEEFRFGLPQKALMGDGGRARFVIPVGSYLDGANLKNKTLTLTISDGWGAAVEQTIKLNALGTVIETLAKSD
jgi:suppressor for copper-sensitivity B